MTAILARYMTDSAMQPLLLEQFKTVDLTFPLAIAGTTVIALLVKAVVGLRPSDELESIGLYLAVQGEEGYQG
jgi:ammonium transporter, Amt family